MGGDSEYSIVETSRKLLSAMGMRENMLTFISDRPGQDRRYAIDYSKIRDELGWEPTLTFDQGLEEMVNWYRNNIQWWKPIRESSGYRRWFKSQFGDFI